MYLYSVELYLYVLYWSETIIKYDLLTITATRHSITAE